MRIYTLLKQIVYRLNLIADYVVEQGTSGNWKYEKWNSGKMEVWTIGKQTVTGTSSGSSSLGYDYSATLTIPSGFVNVEVVSGHIAQIPDTGYARWGVLAGWNWASSKPTSMTVCASGFYQSVDKLGYSFEIKGTWK